MPKLLHNHKDFNALISIVANNMSIAPALVEKDYWIMHCLYGLQKMNLTFELKGGTSLSKGYGIIERFSEDIDIRIEPPAEMHEYSGESVPGIPGESVPPIPGQSVPLFQARFVVRIYIIFSNFFLLNDSPFSSSR